MTHPKYTINQKIGMLKILAYESRKWRGYYYCKCDCGTERWINGNTLNSKNPSCGCVSRYKAKDITNGRYGKLTAKYPTGEKGKNGSLYWHCECDGGKSIDVTVASLQKQARKSCGCVNSEKSRANGIKVGAKTKECCMDGTNIRNLTANIAKNNTSGIKGVSYDKILNKWMAQIEFKKKHYHLGRYDTIEKAAKVRKTAEEKLFGEFLEEFKKR